MERMNVEVSVGEHLYNHRRFFYHRQQCDTRLQLVLAHNDHRVKCILLQILSHVSNTQTHATRWHSQPVRAYVSMPFLCGGTRNRHIENRSAAKDMCERRTVARQHEMNVQIIASRESGNPSRPMNVASIASTYAANIRFSSGKCPARTI